MSKLNKLSKAEMKNVLVGGDDAIIKGGYYKCCNSNGGCSGCHYYDVTPSCPGFNLTAC